MAILLNLLLGLIPTFVLAGSIAAGTDDDPRHRRVFLLVYGLWALTLAIGNWVKGTHVAWLAIWTIFGVVALALSFRPARLK